MKSLAFAAASCLLLFGGFAFAQAAPTVALSLSEAQKEAAAAAVRARQFARQAETATSEAERAKAQSEGLIAQIDEAESGITAAELRVAQIDRIHRKQQKQLSERQQPVVRLVAALQSLSMRPPALALIQPGSKQDALRTRALLASTLPVIRKRTAALRAEIEKTNRLNGQARQAAADLARQRIALRQKRIELTAFEEAQRGQSQDLVHRSLYQEDRSLAFGEEARRISTELSSSAYRVRLAQELAALPPPTPRPGSAFRSSASAPYRLPVSGDLVTGFGEISPAGIHSRGLTFATKNDAPAVAPRAGAIVYAGRFRSYGEVVIVDHGGGWSSTITGLKTLLVKRGDKVSSGQPLGRAGGMVNVELRRNGSPRPVISFIALG